MNARLKNQKEWIFPARIGFENVSLYTEKLQLQSRDNNIIFDLRETVDIHSSFIGFLIIAKNTINKHENDLLLILSYSAARILKMLNILDYFESEIVPLREKKSA
ncbi:MAG: hypothetical protein GY754_18610 [bacterium]|nr:hypothetical protein [bacterium]